ncbi:hypothetical protein [Owenweeksia hongkongensis]|uniref:hypothetical protein n=1 Tax=Owenweeksia hongkongensis TaxID=253245 RepID=UPI003A9039BD
MRKFLSLIPFLCLILSFSSSYAQPSGIKIKQTEDTFEGTKTVLMDGNKVKVEGLAESAVIKGALSVLKGGLQISQIKTELNLEQFTKSNGSKELSVIVSIEIKDDASFYIDNGESLILLVDGKRMGLTTEGEFNVSRSARRNSVTNARYDLTEAQLKSILEAKSVQFRIMNGGFMEKKEETRDKEGRYFEGGFTEKNKEAWKYFYDTYVNS